MFITDKEILKEFYSGNRVWQLVPGIERTPGGRLFCTFYSGRATETLGNYCVILQSDDDGQTWTEPIFGAYDGQMNRCFDPVLWLDPLGRLWFTWAAGHRYGVYGVICDDPDAEELVWSDEFYIGEGVMMNKPTVLSTGEWLFPIALWDYWFTADTFNQIKWYGDLFLEEYLEKQEAYSGANVYKTVDSGKTIRLVGGNRKIQSRSHDEHMIYEKKNGVLVMLTRTNYGISKSYSYDKGTTWTIAENSGIAGPASRFCVRRLKSGRLLLINHYNFKGRNNLTAFLSEDDGETWPYKLLLDERDQVSYPDMTEGEDGYLYIVYDRERGGYYNTLEETVSCAREILLAKVNEKDIMEGALCSEGSFLKRIVSKLKEYTGKQDFFTGYPPVIEPQEFVDKVMTYENPDKILEALYVYYPIDFRNLNGADIHKIDELIGNVKLSIHSESELRTCLMSLTEFISDFRLIRDGTRGETYVSSLLDYIQDSIAQNMDLKWFAEKNGISVYYLSYIFKKKIGMSVQEYRTQCRFAEAKRLLIDTDKSVWEICVACGFSDLGYFTRKFRESEKITPVEYRSMLG